ncbi:MAG: hypothetical protein ACKO5J_05680, partial [Rubrivivax sp.]
MNNRDLRTWLSEKSELPIAVFSNRTVMSVQGWLPAEPTETPDAALPEMFKDWIKRVDALGKSQPVGSYLWQPALVKDIELYGAGLLTERKERGAFTSVVAKLPPRQRLPRVSAKRDPARAIKYVRAQRVLPGVLEDPPVPDPQLIWYDPTLFGDSGRIQLAWRFQFTGERPADVLVSLDGASTLGVISRDPDSPLTFATSPRYLPDPVTGVPRFVSFEPPLLLPQATLGNPIAVAESFFRQFPAMFGTGEPSQQLSFKQLEADLDRGQHVVFQQLYAGMPVWGCELRVHLNDVLAITSISGRYYRDPDVDVTPTVSEQQAFSLAMNAWMRLNGG